MGEEISTETSTQDEYGELRTIIGFIRSRMGQQAEAYLKNKEEFEAKQADFLSPESRLVADRSLLMVLRQWNSYTPALPVSQDDERHRGGGYFLWHQGHGTVIDPGFSFLENFYAAGGRACDIHNVVLTHAHPDHTAEFETLRTLLFEFNDKLPQESPRRKVRFFLNNGAFRKFACLLDLRDHEFTEGVFTLNQGTEFELAGGGRLRVLPAYHDELLSRDQSCQIWKHITNSTSHLRKTNERTAFGWRSHVARPSGSSMTGSFIRRAGPPRA